MQEYKAILMGTGKGQLTLGDDKIVFKPANFKRDTVEIEYKSIIWVNKPNPIARALSIVFFPLMVIAALGGATAGSSTVRLDIMTGYGMNFKFHIRPQRQTRHAIAFVKEKTANNPKV